MIKKTKILVKKSQVRPNDERDTMRKDIVMIFPGGERAACKGINAVYIQMVLILNNKTNLFPYALMPFQ